MNKEKVWSLLALKVIILILIWNIGIYIGANAKCEYKNQAIELSNKLGKLELENKNLKSKLNEAEDYFYESKKEEKKPEEVLVESIEKKPSAEELIAEKKLNLKTIEEVEQINEFWEVIPLCFNFQYSIFGRHGEDFYSNKGMFAIIEFKITNKSKEPREYNFLEVNRYIDISTNEIYTPDVKNSCLLYEKERFSAARKDVISGFNNSIINSGESKSLMVAFQVPKESLITNAVLGVDFNETGLKSIWAVKK